MQLNWMVRYVNMHGVCTWHVQGCPENLPDPAGMIRTIGMRDDAGMVMNANSCSVGPNG